ncbi:MAG: hypothetical protein AAF514_03585 [Verrucomicrobiota bacterium]
MDRHWAMLTGLIMAATGTGFILTVQKNRNLEKLAEASRAPRGQLASSGGLPTSSGSSGTETDSNAPHPQEAQRLDIAHSVAALRGLAFRRPLTFQQLTTENLDSFLLRDVGRRFPAGALDRMTTAYQAMGFVEKDVDLTQVYKTIATANVTARFNRESGRLFITDDCDMKETRSRMEMAREVIHHLQDDHYQLTQLLLPPELQADHAAALQALVTGDRYSHAARLMEEKEGLDAPFPQDSDKTLSTLPAFLKGEIEFARVAGRAFCEALINADRLISAYERPPTCSTHILHPESYLKRPPFQPRRIRWAQVNVMGGHPIWDNIAGELGIRLLLQQALPADRAATVASGWAGDGFLVYERGTDTHVVWKTLWRSPVQAATFARALSEAAPDLYGTTGEGQRSPDGKIIEFGDPEPLIIQQDGAEIFVIRSRDAGWRETLRTLALNARID